MPYINIQHPSRPITHFRPGKIVTSFIGPILWQFPTAVCSHLRGSLSSASHLSQLYSRGLPIKIIPIFITPENTGASSPEKSMSFHHPQINKQNQTSELLKKKVHFVFKRDDRRSPARGGLSKTWSVVPKRINYGQESPCFFLSSGEQIGSYSM